MDNSQISELDKENRWNKIHSKIGNRDDVKNQYDGWLEQNEYVQTIIERTQRPIIDLGCGSGNNTLHLIENGKEVIACDFSDVALQKIKQNIPEARTIKCNMLEGLPFEDEYTDLVVSDLSLHYFSKEDTRKILSDISRILTTGGCLAFRVNSTKDNFYGANASEDCKQLEENYYEVRGTTKRFFDEKSLRDFFQDWDIKLLENGEMPEENIRTLWQDGKTIQQKHKKFLWTGIVKKGGCE